MLIKGFKKKYLSHEKNAHACATLKLKLAALILQSSKGVVSSTAKQVQAWLGVRNIRCKAVSPWMALPDL